MDICTASIADTVSVHTHNTLKLSVISHKYAAQIVAHSLAVERHARKLLKIDVKINPEVIVLAGPYYAEHHNICSQERCSIDKQEHYT